MKFFYRLSLMAALFLGICFSAQAAGWPANFQGVMLQGFYWDSYQNETKWTKLEAQADELAGSFRLIWVPNSGRSTGGLGYMPVYWFTNHNSNMGSEQQLISMIKTFKSKGLGTIADVVINHRAGKSNWTDFPEEEWNGVKWKIGPEGICSTDEVRNASGQAKPTGAPDTGEDFDGARDLDHTNANVQNNCKNYCKCLLEKYGYEGFRLDMVKGYAGRFTKIYNEYSRPTFSVGEYWDGSYDALAAWIESTGRNSAAFDFAFKYAVNKAFAENDMSQLCWKANGTTDQPAGLIHFGYAQYAVTFIDNHDTYRDSWNKFNGNVLAANAFMICSPGTPCVFLPHWTQYKGQIKQMIAVRNSCGVHNMSAVNVLKCERNCYMAEVTGTKGKLVVRIGSSSETPQGYSSADVKASGNGYCIWSKTAVTGGNGGGGTVTPDPTPSYPSKLYMMGHVNGCDWNPSKGVVASGNKGVYTWSGVTIDKSSDKPYGYISFATALGTSAEDWDGVNGGDRYGASTADEVASADKSIVVVAYPAGESASGCASWAITPGTYTFTVDLTKSVMTFKAGTSKPGTNPTPDPGTTEPDPTPVGSYPSTLYLMGHVNGQATAVGWDPMKGVPAKGNNGEYVFRNVTIDDCGNGSGYFSFVTALSEVPDDWDGVNSSDRYGADAPDAPLAPGSSAKIVLYAVDVDAMGAYAWMAPAGVCDIVANLAKMTVSMSSVGGSNPGDDAVETIEADGAAVHYFNLQGMPVENPEKGLFIRVSGKKVEKVLVR